MHVLRDHWGTRGISQVDAAALKEAVDREPLQQIEAIASRSQSPTSATKSATRVNSHRSTVGAIRKAANVAVSLKSDQQYPTGA